MSLPMQLKGKLCLTALLCGTLSGCYGLGDYLAATEGAAPGTYVDFEAFRAKGSPRTYVASEDVQPLMEGRLKLRMVPIRTTDIWEERYRVDDNLLLVSKTYNDRQCRALASTGLTDIARVSSLRGTCNGDYLYGIYVNEAGDITRGWKLIRNPERHVLRSSQITLRYSEENSNAGWPTTLRFMRKQ